MTDFWKQSEGQIIDNTFPLQLFLGDTDHSAVFLTQRAGAKSPRAAIKLIPARISADLQLSLWRRAGQLEHPNLLRLFDVGRCRLADTELLYVVMEHAEEDLSQILPQRSLSASEAREMLEPVLDVLVYLHSKGLTHSHIKPSNLLATAERLKLSSDTLFPIGEARKPSRQLDAYDAPETATSPVSPAADVWSLGVTLVEALTQRAPLWQPGNQADPGLPDTLPQPFLDVARHALRRDLRRRWTIAEIAARLNPVTAAAAAAHSVSPIAVPLSPVPAVPAAKLQVPRSVPPALKIQPPVPKAQPPRLKSQPPLPQTEDEPKQALVLPNYVIPLAAAIFVIGAIIALPKILNRRPEVSPASTSASTQPAPRENASATKSFKPAPAKDSMKSAAGKNPAAEPLSTPAPAVSESPAAPAPASLRTETLPPANAPQTAPSSAARGDVLDQVLPDVSEKARATIQGTVRVGVRVHVDAAGNVSQAELDSPGPSSFFADLALQAAQRWQFSSPEVDGHSVPSEWLIRFEFTQSGTQAFPKETTP